MRQYVCDRCGVVMDGKPVIWHRSIPSADHEGHYDLCSECDLDICNAINHGLVIDGSVTLRLQ